MARPSADDATEPQPDALVIGGGPAGLAAALYPARFRRRVLLVEDGTSRPQTIPCSHNYPGFAEGVSGPDLLSAMRRQAERHGVRFAQGRIESLARADGGLHARWRSGTIAAH